jgi:copper chaperone CopZ
MKGVESVSVSYPTGSAAIEFDPAVVTLQQLQKAIQADVRRAAGAAEKASILDRIKAEVQGGFCACEV